MLRFHDLCLSRQAEILDLIQIESGKARAQAFEEVIDTATCARYYGRTAASHLRPRRRSGAFPVLSQSVESLLPKGVVGVVSPWNYPFSLAITDLVPALLAGNAVVLRPDLQTTLTALKGVALLAEAGLPEGVLQVVVGSGATVGQAVVDQVDYVCYTGSTATGRQVAESAARRLVGVSLELGGKNTLYVRADADLDRAVRGAVRAAFASGGQLCMHTERLVLDASIADVFLEKFVPAVRSMRLGPELRWGRDMGSLLAQAQLDRTVEHVEDARSKGARVLAGGRTRPDLGPFFHEPTVLEGVLPGMACRDEETFGPVVSVYRVAGDDEAVALANDTAYGLNASIFTRDVRTGRALARRIRCGTVNINEGYAAAWGSMAAPMGGMKDSGLGRRHGADGIRKYCEPQNVTAQHLLGFEPVLGLSDERWAASLTTALGLMKKLGSSVTAHDHDVVVIGTGFGGAVSAMRLAEKGYRVHMLESGRRFEDADFATTSWDLRNYLWAPRLGCFGVQRVHKLPDVMILAGAGVGGGSLNYANTLYIPPPAFFRDRQWGHITDWQDELAPHYAEASRMLGVVVNPVEGPVEEIMRRSADALGVGHTFRKTPVGVYFGRPGERVADPYFGGSGPERTGCTLCGNCMVGCRDGAKNTLVKNYLWFAERAGVSIEPLRTVVDVRPLDPRHPESGYAVTSERTGAWWRRERRTVTTDQVVVAAGAWGTQKLLHAMHTGGGRRRPGLPRLSARLGELTRTNSEALGGTMTERVPRGMDLSRGIAITTSFNVDDDTHVENCRYGKGSNAMGLMSTVMVEGGGRVPRPLRWVAEIVRHPLVALRSLSNWKWSERTVIALVMQSSDNSLTVSGTRGPFGGVGLTSTQGHGRPNPTWIPEGARAIREMAAQLGAITRLRAFPGSSLGEIADIPLTAHFLGGAPISDSPETGVVDPYHRAWNYPGLHVVDGASVSANLGVNPSLTITAQAERAMSLWPVKGEPDARPPQGEPYRRLEAQHPARSVATAG